MITLGIIAILFTAFNIWFNIYLDKKLKADGNLIFLLMTNGIWGVLILAFFLALEEKDTPKAIDVYRNKTELEITSVNGVPRDTVVVWKGGKQ